MIVRFLVLAISAFLAVSCAKSKTSGRAVKPDPLQPLACAGGFKSDTCTSLSWLKLPTDAAAGSFEFSLLGKDGAEKRIEWDGPVAVVLWMPAHGHGSDEPVTVTKLAPGQYRATNVRFSMRGEWQIIVQLKNGDSVQDEAIISYTY